MSKIEVKIVKVDIKPHDNADRLALCQIGGEGGYISVVGKSQFKTGDLAIYVPPDSVLTEEMSVKIKQGSKIEFSNGRIKATKIRGVLSEGLCLKPEEWLSQEQIKEGADVTDVLGITKYQPPEQGCPNSLKSGKGINFNYVNTNFPEYWDVAHLKKYPNAIKEGEEVVATIKWHGTNFRAGYVSKPDATTLWKKIVRFFEKDKFEFLVGSHAKIKKISKGKDTNEAKRTDTYWRAAEKYKLEEVTKAISKAYNNAEVIVYAEIIGPGIQKGYDYGVKEGDIEIKAFDIKINKKYLDWEPFTLLCGLYKLPIADVAYRGPWNNDVRKYAKAIDDCNGKKFVREGIVIKLAVERKDSKCGRVILKHLNEDYLLDKTNSEFH